MSKFLRIFSEEHYSNELDQARRFWQGEALCNFGQSVKHNDSQLFPLSAGKLHSLNPLLVGLR